jgi:hypothetical protein
MTTGNLLVSESNVTLGNVSNLHISGGTSGYILQTDGSGVLSWASPAATQSPAPMPLTVDAGNTLTISANYQGLYGTPITVDGTIAIDGILVDVSGQGAPGSNSQITFNDDGNPAANNGFTFNKTTGNLAVPGNITVTGNILPSGDITYDLGNNTRRFKDLYLSGNTIYLGNANITANGSTLTLPAGTIITGTGTVGNIANLNLNGNSGQVLYGNGVFAGVSATTAQTANTVTVAAQPNITSVGTLTSLTTSGLLTAGGNIIPSANNTFSLGNATNYFKDAYIGPGSLYINGTKVLEEASQEIVITADLNQTVKVSTSGSGDISLDPTGTGSILVKGALQMQAGENITTSNGSPVTIATGIKTDSITTYSANTNLTISANGSGIVNINDDLTVQGNLIIDGGAGNLSVTSLSVQDNIIDLSAETTGVPTSNAGIRVVRGDEPAVQLRWNEPSDIWQYTTDGTNYLNIVGTTAAGATALGNAATANFFTGTLTTASQPNITSVGTLTSLAVTGNITAGNVSATTFTGSLTGAATSATTAGTVTTAAQPNITSTGTLTSLTVTGTTSAGNLNTGGNLTVSGNATVSGNLNVEGNLVYINVSTLSVSDPIIQLQTGPNGAAPTSNSGKDVGTGLNYYDTQARVAFMGFDVSNNEFGMASVATITNEVVTFTTYGNLRVGNIIGNGQALTSITAANINGQVANALVAGTVYTAAQPNITSVGTLTSLAVTGNITAGNVSATTFTGALSGAATSATTAGTVTTAAQPNITSVGTLLTLSVTGNANVGNIGATNGIFTTVQGTLSTAAQPNITSLGTLSALTVSGVTNLGANGNVIITGGTNGQVLSTNGSGNLSWTSISSTSISNGNSNVNIPASAGNVNVSVNGTANVLIVTSTGANIAGTLNATGNANVGNIGATAGAFTTVAGSLTTASQPNITGVGTVTTGIWNNNIGSSATFAAGLSGANLASITAANISGTVASATAATNASALLQNTSTSTTVYPTFTTSSANGNSQAVFNTSISANLSNASITATTFVGALSGAATSATTAGTVTTAAQPNITSLGTLTSLGVNGTITGVNITANTGVFTGNANGISSVQAANIVGTTLSSTVVTSSLTTVGTLGSLTVTGNISAGNLTCSSGTVTAATLTETSSIALKENFRPIEDPLGKLLQLVGVMYDRKDGSNKNEIGLVSEDVEKIIPELVKNDTVAYTRLTVYLLESIKVLKDEIDSLKGNKRKSKK